MNTDQKQKKTIQFNAYAVTNEFDLNKIAIECGFKKKYTWEEPLILKDKLLSEILNTSVSSEQTVRIFAFGSIVYINIDEKDENKIINYLKKFKPEINLKKWKEYNEKYGLHIDEELENIELEDKFVTIPEYDIFYPEVISMIIAKSVALEKIEEQLEGILDEIELTIDRLENGRIQISNKKLAKSISKVIRHEYNSIAYIMILDKPEIAWLNTETDNFYEMLSEFYELNDRYLILKEKTEIINQIIEGFTSISQSARGLVIEWVILVLIIAEVVLMTLELIK